MPFEIFWRQFSRILVEMPEMFHKSIAFWEGRKRVLGVDSMRGRSKKSLKWDYLLAMCRNYKNNVIIFLMNIHLREITTHAIKNSFLQIPGPSSAQNSNRNLTSQHANLSIFNFCSISDFLHWILLISSACEPLCRRDSKFVCKLISSASYCNLDSCSFICLPLMDLGHQKRTWAVWDSQHGTPSSRRHRQMTDAIHSQQEGYFSCWHFWIFHIFH